MSHFILISQQEMFESPMHEDNGVSIGDSTTWLCSKTAAAAINAARPAGRAFTANSTTNRKWLDKFTAHTGHDPEYIRFARGIKHTDRWYARAISF